MKKRPEDDLVGDVFPKLADFRVASLERMLFAARRQRRRRTVVHVSGILTIGLCLTVLLLNFRNEAERPNTQVVVNHPSSPTKNNFPTVPGTSIRVLSDEELLTLFKDRPVALMGPPEERQFVILDELRKEKTNGALNL